MHPAYIHIHIHRTRLVGTTLHLQLCHNDKSCLAWEKYRGVGSLPGSSVWSMHWVSA